jgi:SMC interacting uncharacterized protein involved in chromosome segregation
MTMGVAGSSAPAASVPRMSDPRPIGDKAFTKDCITRLVLFLTAHHFDGVLTPKQLASPTKSDFMKIFQFIVRIASPKFELDNGAIEEDVRKVMAHLKYGPADHCTLLLPARAHPLRTAPLSPVPCWSTGIRF